MEDFLCDIIQPLSPTNMSSSTEHSDSNSEANNNSETYRKLKKNKSSSSSKRSDLACELTITEHTANTCNSIEPPSRLILRETEIALSFLKKEDNESPCTDDDNDEQIECNEDGGRSFTCYQNDSFWRSSKVAEPIRRKSCCLKNEKADNKVNQDYDIIGESADLLTNGVLMHCDKECIHSHNLFAASVSLEHSSSNPILTANEYELGTSLPQRQSSFPAPVVPGAPSASSPSSSLWGTNTVERNTITGRAPMAVTSENWERYGGERSCYTSKFYRFIGLLLQMYHWFFQKAEGWLFAALIAMLTGFASAWIEICVKYLSDLRIGVCRGMIWQARSFCCGSRGAVDFENNSCYINESPVSRMDRVEHAKWVAWSLIFRIPGRTSAYIADYSMYIIIATGLAVLAAWLCRHFAPLAAGSGIPEVKTILGGFVINGVLGGWTALIKIVGLSLGAASGLSLGKEGPLVHIACCFADLVGRLSLKYNDSEIKRRELLSAASAAGVSVAFGAPLGGVLFSLEEVSSYFPPETLWKSFFGAVIGALTLKWLDATGTGRLTLFQMDSVSLLGTWQLVELIPFAVIGLIGGSVGTLFIRLNVHWMEKKAQYSHIAAHPIYEVAVVTILCSLLNYPVAGLRVPCPTLLEQMFSRCGVGADPDIFSLCSARRDDEYSYSDYSLKWSVFAELAFAAVIRFIQTCFTFGMGIPAGLFIPSLTIGALCGRLVGLLTIRLNSIFGFVDCHKCLHPGVYAIVGAAAMLGGITRVTISVVVIMFELTGGLSYVVPFMVSVMIAKWVGDALCEHSIYDCFIRLKGYPFLNTTDSSAFTAKAQDIMETKLCIVTLEGNTVGSLKRKLERYNYSGFPLVNTRRDRLLIGFIVAGELKRALDDAAKAYPNLPDMTPVYFRKEATARHQKKTEFRELDYKRTSFKYVSHEEQMSDFDDPEYAERRRLNYVTGISEEENGVDSNMPTELDFSHLIRAQTMQLVPETPLGQLANIFQQLGLRFCLLTHRGRLEGLLTRRRFLAHVERLRHLQNDSN